MKHINRPQRGLAIACLSLAFWGCETDPQDQMDSLLDAALTTASGGVGRSYFEIPDERNLGEIPADPRNPLTADKVELGRLLFHETALSTNSNLPEGRGTYSCASCHNSEAGFTAGRHQAIGDGGWGFGIRGESRTVNPAYSAADVDVQQIKSPSALNAAYQTLSMWNGQFGVGGQNVGTEALWTAGTDLENNLLGYAGPETQAIAGLAAHRMEVGPELLRQVPEYRRLFDRAFRDVHPKDRVSRETAGLAIAAYERTLLSGNAPFQQWLKGDPDAMDDEQKNGALLFFGKARCSNCHTGPALNSNTFQAIGLKGLVGGEVLRSDPNDPAHLGRGGFTQKAEDMHRFKVPQLYNLRDMGFYGHGANFTSVEDIVRYYNAGIPQDPAVPTSQLAADFQALQLSEEEMLDLTRFLETGLYDRTLQRHVPDRVPSGQCFPNSDAASRSDLNCG